MSALALRLARLVLADPARARAEAERIDKAERARQARKSARPAPRAVTLAKERKAAKKQQRREGIDKSWHAVMVAGRTCVIPTCVFPAQHAHHIISGSGKRRTYEAADTLAPLCEMHHRLIHRGHLLTLALLAQWASVFASRTACDALDHRIAKIREARSSLPGNATKENT